LEYHSNPSDGEFGANDLEGPIEVEYTDDFPENQNLRRVSRGNRDDILDSSPEKSPNRIIIEDGGSEHLEDAEDDSDGEEVVEKVDLSSSEFACLKREPEEEYFMLAVLALKMVHTEIFDDAEYVYEVSAAKLFKQVRDQKMPFHQWYNWLEDKFAELRGAFMVQQAAKQKLLEQ